MSPTRHRPAAAVADALGTTVLAGMLGAMLLCRAAQSTQPLEVAAERVATMVEVAITSAGSAG